MSDSIDMLKELSLLIRNATKSGENTAERVGRTFVGIVDILSEVTLDKLKNLFLRKDIPDSTKHLLSLFGGAVFGKDGFAEGLTGFGAKIDDNGNAEVESLTSRRFIETPEFRYNRVDVKVGDKWRAPGAGIIESVDTESKICTLKLEEGEIGAVAVGDICMGIFHSLTSSDNATEDTDDSRGNRTFAGFCTVYFTITEVMGDRNEQFKYQLRPVSERWKFSFDPFEMMNFVAYGSFSRTDRQTSVYETRTYTRHLWKQNTWEIGVANIAKQSGDLSNLNVFGMNMEGYSEYTNSVYFTGTITQVKPDGTPVITANDRGAWNNNTQYYYYDRVSHDGRIWLCINENGTSTEPSTQNPNWLLQVDKGEAGQDGTSFRILGSKDDKSQLPQDNNEVGDGYLIQGHLWVWDGSQWNDAGVIQGPAGESVQNMGGWYNGLFVPYLGVVRMGNATFMCTKKDGTYNPPYYTLMDNDGNRIKTEGGYIITGEINNAEYQLIAQDGADGKDGKDGQDGAPGKDGQDGEQGIEGCVVRDSEWTIGTEYRNDSNITDSSLPIRYIDVVLVRNDAVETGWDVYRCKLTHVASSSITYTNTSYWEKFGLNVSAIFTSLIIAKNAKIQFLQGNQLTIQKSDGTITAGLSGSEEGKKIRIWAGSENPDDAPYRVDENGETWQTNAHVTGEINATSGNFENVTIKGRFLSPFTYLSGVGYPPISSGAPFRWLYRIGKDNLFSSNNNMNYIVEGSVDGEYHEVTFPADKDFAGMYVNIYNNGTGAVYVKQEGNSDILTINPGVCNRFICISTETKFLKWVCDIGSYWNS